MSAQHQDSEQVHAADERASSTSSSPPRRDPVEDIGDNFTRKRQRLDDGGAVLRAMSTDPDSPSRVITSPHKEMVAMTIREHSPPPPSPTAEPEHEDVTVGYSAHQTPKHAHSIEGLDGTRDNSTSPLVIEIIDEDEDNGLSRSITMQVNAEDFFSQFPYNEQFRSVLQALNAIIDFVQKNEEIPPNLLSSLSQWLRNLPEDTTSHLQSFYVSGAAFWIGFADLIERLLKRRYLWMTALETEQDDDMSRYPLGENIGDAAVDDAFSDFFSAYVRLCSQIFLVDACLLKRPRLEEHYSSHLLSEKHMMHLNTILRSEKASLFRRLRKQHDIDTRDISSRLHTVFLSADGAQNLFELAEAIFRTVPTIVQNQMALCISQVLGTLGWTVCRHTTMHGSIDPEEFCRDTLRFFRQYTEDLQDPAKVNDATMARELISCFSSLIQGVSQWSRSSARSLAEELLNTQDQASLAVSSSPDSERGAGAQIHGQDPEVLPTLIANTWKFDLLRKYIEKGRMELRVMSITFMDEALVNLYRENNTSESPNKHPVLRHLSEILLRGRVVDYIVSADSHPQIISRSGNVAGFLLVTDRWSDDQADAIWNIISHSPDPRMVAATMTMLHNIISLMKPADYLYFCMKLHDLPVASYTSEILRFLRDLTTRLLERHAPVDWSSRDETARPWNVCVRLLQDTAPRNGATKHDLALNAEVEDQLRFMARGIPEADQQSIYERCLEHIFARSTKATGSVRVVFILSSLINTSFLQQNEGMVRRLVQELSSFVDSEAAGASHRYQLTALQHRLELLAFMICRVGQLIPEDLYIPVWDHIVGEKALSNHARDVAWAQLLHATKAAPKNEFCQQLISTYLPNMDPSYFTPGLYNYVANYSFELSHKTIHIDGVDQSLLQIPGGDLLWSLALSSPPGTIEELAARELAVRYTQVSYSRDIALPDVEAAHVELVERCMKELRSCFTVLREGISEGGQDGQLRFSRVLILLRQMLELVRQKPEFNRGRRADSKVESMDSGIPPADAVTIRYQFVNDRQSVIIAPDRTVADLYRMLCRATECSKINLFAGGQRVDVAQRADQKVSDANIGGQLLIQPVQRDETTNSISAPVAGSSEFETKLVRNFDEMFGWMDSNDVTSQMLFEFLTLFPYRSTITNSVAAGDATFECLFPPAKFFQAKYAAQAIQSKLKGQLSTSTLDEKFLLHAVKLLDRALLSAELLGDDDDSVANELPLAAVFISAMLDFLRERPSCDLSGDYFSDAPALANRLISILLAAIRTPGATKIAHECYSLILEASLYSEVVWETFWGHSQIHIIHQMLLLSDARATLRESIKLKILSLCGGHLPSSCPLIIADIASRYWTAIASILPRAVQLAEQSVQIFELAQHVFRVFDEHHRNEDNSRALLQNWSSWLLAYDHTEVPGRYETDCVVLGFTKLLLCLVPSLKSYKRPLNASALISSIFQKFLFNDTLHDGSEDDFASAPLPVLESSTRRELYDLMLALTDDLQSYERLLRLCGEVENKPIDNVLPNLSVDRAVEVRSRTGYVGLHNPRAICYMNSLLAQLFMNLDFRHFMLSLEVKDGNGAQRLLLETQKLFATMQNSYRKSADPRPFAECIRTLDKTPIDISVQMDADEFYNLLFDQWEAQLMNERDKRQFRSFYGGQMLQQVKSKQCKHVSERADSFFALQCDVQGKANLQESLQAFVQGDVMEGDNKYKCESCGGKFVDAVKRTCLKSAPDNLIFHLKRFDFDLTDFSRKKVHEHFAFPESIDIGLFNVEHLSDPVTPHKEDIFDLVGVVVHFGNCENGHYYSYIRKRPCQTGDASPTWLNFNDELVDPFDPSEIPQKAFGGCVEDGFTRQYKMYSAYMLFYQRRTAFESDRREWIVSSATEPPKVEIPHPIKRDIDIMNGTFVREYCLFDPFHSAFVRQLHGMSRRISNGTCSETHQYESRAMDVFLAHLGRIVWRQQNTGIFEEAFVHLRRFVQACETCYNFALTWLAQDDEVLHNLLLRCHHASVRFQTRQFLVGGLRAIHDKDSYLLNAAADNDMVPDIAEDTGIIVSIARRLAHLVESSSKSTKAWDDLYLLLTQVVEIGHVEASAVLDAGILSFCLRLFCLHVDPKLAEDYIDFHRAFQKRAGIFNRLIRFVSTLLSRMDISLPTSSNRMRHIDNERLAFPLAAAERAALLYWHDESKAYAAVDKMIELFDPSKTESFYPGEIVKWMTGSHDIRIQRNIMIMMIQGISELNYPYCDLYIRAASIYCEAATNVETLNKVCDTVVNTVSAIEQLSDEKTAPSGGDVLRFLNHLLEMQNPHLLTVDIHWCLITRSPKYASVLLLYSDESVRNDTHEFIRDLYTQFMEDPQNWPAAFACARAAVTDVIKRIAYESSAGMPRTHLTPLLETGKFLISLLCELDQSEDPEIAEFKHVDDKALISQWQIEVESRVRMLPPDADLPSPGEGALDASDYGSESDDVELLDS